MQDDMNMQCLTALLEILFASMAATAAVVYFLF